ncbi:KTSC domain-containing protein [Ramlibacter tataouinensis]|uniref:KTSC domain-containing protein n=1 Tax=Ramlibacter tataouinensis (strain ATCC BAA-407 / DSM 14655 / LMG 21543 / TTB310) TaxID=365046 RepID=F5XZX6_RAMTT|nr:KTSC domain-containing protein [Ramlibacter tataouinensis]AEG93337.1 Hypothetical protein Rta_22400 [Ramlibacter tataouinensis TTB310]
MAEGFPFPEHGRRYYARTEGLSQGVRSLAYERDRQTLDIEFASRESYRYHGVEPEEFVALMTSGSLGIYVNQHIKPRHRCDKLGRAPRADA